MKNDSLKISHRQGYIYTIPNFITLFRLLLIPFILYFIVKDRIIIVVILFTITTISDMLDGLLARKLKQSSYYGGMFDAITDTILILSTSLFGFLTGKIFLLLLILLFAPKTITFLISILFHKAEYKPTIFSRLSSVFFYISLPLILLNLSNILEYIFIFCIYVLSIIHWVKLVLLRK